jgi:hypothetical protein
MPVVEDRKGAGHSRYPWQEKRGNTSTLFSGYKYKYK